MWCTSVDISKEIATPIFRTGDRCNSSFEMLVMIYQIACCHIPKKENNKNPHPPPNENFKSQMRLLG
jgi:hypothetical protein